MSNALHHELLDHQFLFDGVFQNPSAVVRMIYMLGILSGHMVYRKTGRIVEY